ncbi:ribonuclease III [Flavobacteriaceae bacterium UJ101]|nr:ribonuclease III [Flavobacteriaceae bacterium UJ101]
MVDTTHVLFLRDINLMIQIFKNIFSRPKQGGIFYNKIKVIVGFPPQDISLYIEAFTHRSISKKNRETGKRLNYERLEFLGDAILGAVIAHWLYTESPNEQEGYLTQMRSKIVSRKNLNNLGEKLELKSLIRSKTKDSKDILGDVFEALIGAIYEDQGYEACRKFIHKKIINPFIDLDQLENQISSYKSLMIEWSQKNRKVIEFVTIEEENAEENIVFMSSIMIDEKIIAKGRANSKKKAEEISAKRAYFTMQDELSSSK